MRLPPFEYLEPRSVAEACALLAQDPEGSAVFAGGTDLLVNLKERLVTYRRLIALQRIAGLGEIGFSEAEGLRIGAIATVNQVARHEAIGRHYPGIVDAASSLAAEQVRNLATVGGNLCSAVPSADLAPVLLALGARVRVVSPAGERLIPLRELFTGPRATVLGRTDLLVAIEVPPAAAGVSSASMRQGGRESLSLPWAIAAAAVTMEGDICAEATVALGAVAPTPIIAAGVGELLAGRSLTAELLVEAGEIAAAAARPIDDLRASKVHRLELVRVLTRRALARAAERAGKG
ncbi:MAG: xanthine dehydrogenase family protein subunit M [Acidobacteriota bacterium]